MNLRLTDEDAARLKALAEASRCTMRRFGRSGGHGCHQDPAVEPSLHGRQVWNKQGKDEILLYVDEVSLGYETRLRAYGITTTSPSY